MSKSHNTAKIILRKEKINAAGKAPLAMQVFIGGQRKIIGLGISIEPLHFNLVSQTVSIPRDIPQSRKINALISKRLTECNDIFYHANYHGIELTMTDFLKQSGQKSNRDSFSEFLKVEIDASVGQMADETVKGYKISSKYFHEYARKENVFFAEINQEWVEGLEKWLKAKPLDVNTRHKHHKNLKKFLNLAVARGKAVVNPYARYKVKKAKTIPEWLTPSEVEILFNLYNRRCLRIEWQRVLRYFLFSCVNGGLRISDLTALQTTNKVGENLVFRPIKTRDSDMQLVVPFSDVGLALWQDKISRDNKLFGCLSDQRSNEAIKKIARMSGIDKDVTMHVARHTFATNYIIFGGRIEMLQDVLGHSKLETTQIYLHLATAFEQKGEQMKNFDKFFRVEPRKIVATQHNII
jgi:site-specific recombinase XerD